MVGTSTEFDSLEFDSLLELCRDHHRRIVLAVLATEDRSLTVNDLTQTILKYNHHVSPSEAPEGESMRIRRSLIHEHVPKLAALSLVDYDQDRQLVTPTAEFDRVQSNLSAIIDLDPKLDAPMTL